MANPSSGDGVQHAGRPAAVRDPTVDIRLTGGVLPEIDEAIAIERGQGTPLTAEVQQHLDPETVRAVALEDTACLNRGAAARATGRPIGVPLGDAVLGRLLNSFGQPSDRGPPLPPDTVYRPIHASAPALDVLGECSGKPRSRVVPR